MQTHPKNLYLELFHGRNSPDQELSDWGLQGPIIGPLEYIQWTYGTHRIGSADWECDLPTTEDLVGPVDGKFYGDFGILTEVPADHQHRVISAEEFRQLTKPKAAT